MNYRTLGRTGLKVSEIGLGTWALGTAIYGQVEKGAPERLIRGAIDSGINLFDTAPLYGTKEEDGVAESVLGRALGRESGSVLVSTKFGRTSSNVMPGRFTGEEARASCEASLRRLGRDHIDVLFFHSPFKPEEIDDGVWAVLGQLKEEGKVRFIGHSVSMFDETAPMSADWMEQRRIDVIQVVLSPFNREARSLIETAIRCNCGVMARECMANGFLSGTITAETKFPPGSLNARYSPEEIAERAGYAASLARAMVREPVESLPQATYRWILDQPGISLALSGAKKPEELADALKATGLPSFSPTTMADVEAMHEKDFGAA